MKKTTIMAVGPQTIIFFGIFMIFAGCASNDDFTRKFLVGNEDRFLSTINLSLLQNNGYSHGLWSQDCSDNTQPKLSIEVTEVNGGFLIIENGFDGSQEKIYSIKQISKNLFLKNGIVQHRGDFYENSVIYAFYSGNRKIIDASYKLLKSNESSVNYIKEGVQIASPLKWMGDLKNSATKKYKLC